MVGGRADFEQALGRRLDPDETAVVEDEGIAVIEQDRVGQIEQERGAADAPHGDAAAMPVAVVEHDAVDDLAARQGVAADEGSGAHHQNRKYRWAIGTTSAGSQTKSSPSARTS